MALATRREGNINTTLCPVKLALVSVSAPAPVKLALVSVSAPVKPALVSVSAPVKLALVSVSAPVKLALVSMLSASEGLVGVVGVDPPPAPKKLPNRRLRIVCLFCWEDDRGEPDDDDDEEDDVDDDVE